MRRLAAFRLFRAPMPPKPKHADALAKNLRKLRQEKDMTQEALSVKAGYATSNYITRVESGQRSVPIKKLMELAKVLDVTPEYLLREPSVDDLRADALQRIVMLLGDSTIEELQAVEKLLAALKIFRSAVVEGRKE